MNLRSSSVVSLFGTLVVLSLSALGCQKVDSKAATAVVPKDVPVAATPPAEPQAAAPSPESAPLTPPAGEGSGGSGASNEAVVATFNGGKITLGQLDDKVASQLLQVRRQGLESLINESLLKAEAQKRGMTEEELTKAEVDSKVKEPTDADIQKLMEEAKKKGQLPPEVNLEQVRPQAMQYLKQKAHQERQQAFVADLKKKANVKLTGAMKLPASARIRVAADGPARGPNNAPVTIVEFSDFECPFCKKARDTVDEVMKAYPNKIRLVFRQYPLESIHPHAAKAAEAALCANDQGKFWKFHDKLFDNREHLDPTDLKTYAKSLGMDTAKFDKCLDSGEHTAAVKADTAAGSKVGVNGTPAFFINGVNLSGAVPLDEFKQIIDLELAAS